MEPLRLVTFPDSLITSLLLSTHKVPQNTKDTIVQAGRVNSGQYWKIIAKDALQSLGIDLKLLTFDCENNEFVVRSKDAKVLQHLGKFMAKNMKNVKNHTA